MSDGITFFKPGAGGGGGAGSGDYVKDAFDDISNPANNNTGFSNVISKNPFGQYFSNDDAPKYGVKTLWVKDLILLEDRTKWVNNKPTYEVVFSENFPGVYAYCFGSVKLLNNPQGVSVSVRQIDDGFGISGVVRQVAFILNPPQTDGTADIIIDGSDTGTDITYGTSAANVVNAGINSMFGPYNATKQDRELHDYRITANNSLNLSVAGVQVYFENSASNIDCFPGSTYLDKTKVTTTSVSQVAVPSITGSNGGVSLVYKTSASAYATSTIETQSLSSVGVGLSGTNTIDVTTGHGSSFPAGVGFVAGAGSSFFIGTVMSVSTDTLTVGPTITFGVSGALYKAWSAGTTLSISSTLYINSFSFDPGQGNVQAVLTNGFGNNSTGDFYYTDPYKQYRIFGDALQYFSLDGNNGIGFNGASLGYLQCEGRFSAVELELSAIPGTTGIIHGTFGINGINGCLGINESITGRQKKTVFTDAGPGWNRFVFTPGTSIGGVVISKINFYQNSYNQGITMGALAYIPHQVNEATRSAISATVGHLGVYQRIFADEMYLTGPWTRGTTHTQAGGVYFQGASTNCSSTVYYYGTKFGFIGTPGTSLAITIDGSAAGNSMNSMINVATLGFHTAVLNHHGGSTVISAFDYVRPMGEIVNVQNYLPRQELDNSPTVYEQSETPVSPKAGDIWARFPAFNEVWIYLFNRWNKIDVLQSVDDPSVGIMVSSFGFTGTDQTTASLTSEQFNLYSWLTSATASGTAACFVSGGDSSFRGLHLVVGGINVSNTVVDTCFSFNKIAWLSTTTLTSVLCNNSKTGNNDVFFYAMGGGTTAGSNSGQTVVEKYNNVSWTTTTSISAARFSLSGGLLSGSVYGFGGMDTGGTDQTNVNVLSSADALTAGTAVPTATRGTAACRFNSSYIILWHVGTSSSTAASYTFNGTAYSSTLTGVNSRLPSRGGAAGSFISNNIAVKNGGDAGGSATNTTEQYNGFAFSSTTASNLNKSTQAGSVS